MTDYAVKLPDRDPAIYCRSDAEVRETLEEFRAQNPETMFANVMVHEMRPHSTVGAERSVFDFVDE